MGFVSGEDAVEVANPPTDCVSDCQAQNQVRGRLTVLGFPFPVPAGSRLVPAFAAPFPPSKGHDGPLTDEGLLPRRGRSPSCVRVSARGAARSQLGPSSSSSSSGPPKPTTLSMPARARPTR